MVDNLNYPRKKLLKIIVRRQCSQVNLALRQRPCDVRIQVKLGEVLELGEIHRENSSEAIIISIFLVC